MTIADDGCGMSEEQTAHVTDPFFTTRTTRTVGLGVPFFKQAAELSGGSDEDKMIYPVDAGRTVLRLSAFSGSVFLACEVKK